MAISLTSEQFISKARDIHGDKYDYSLVDYKTAHTKVTLLCRLHGSFEQAPNHHLKGQGCAKCGTEYRAKLLSAKAKSDFVSKAQATHGDKYDYSLVNYVNAHTKIKIICPIHGVFEQTPNQHISHASGCAKCFYESIGWTRSGFKAKCDKNNNGLGILYVLECFNDSESFIKIGITSRSIKERYDSKVKMPYAFRVIDEITGSPEFIYDLETKMRQQHKEHKYIPNIPFGGSSTECFKQYLTNKKGE